MEIYGDDWVVNPTLPCSIFPVSYCVPLSPVAYSTTLLETTSSQPCYLVLPSIFSEIDFYHIKVCLFYRLNIDWCPLIGNDVYHIAGLTLIYTIKFHVRKQIMWKFRQSDVQYIKLIPDVMYAHASSVSSSEDIKFYLWPFFNRSAPNYSDRRPGGVMG